MSEFLIPRLRFPVMFPATLLAIGLSAIPLRAQAEIYSPLPIQSGTPVTDTLSEQDIPTGMGGFARDYVITFQESDQVVIDLTSDEFDTIITLIAPDGTTVGENDDGPDGTTNSLLFARITRPGNYILRVRSYGGQGLGAFTLNVTRLRPVND